MDGRKTGPNLAAKILRLVCLFSFRVRYLRMSVSFDPPSECLFSNVAGHHKVKSKLLR